MIVAWVVPQLPEACFLEEMKVESLADGLGGLSPFEESLGGEAGGFDGCAGSGRVDAGFFDGPEDLIVLFGAGVDEACMDRRVKSRSLP